MPALWDCRPGACFLSVQSGRTDPCWTPRRHTKPSDTSRETGLCYASPSYFQITPVYECVYMRVFLATPNPLCFLKRRERQRHLCYSIGNWATVKVTTLAWGWSAVVVVDLVVGQAGDRMPGWKVSTRDLFICCMGEGHIVSISLLAHFHLSSSTPIRFLWEQHFYSMTEHVPLPIASSYPCSYVPQFLSMHLHVLHNPMLSIISGKQMNIKSM